MVLAAEHDQWKEPQARVRQHRGNEGKQEQKRRKEEVTKRQKDFPASLSFFSFYWFYTRVTSLKNGGLRRRPAALEFFSFFFVVFVIALLGVAFFLPILFLYPSYFPFLLSCSCHSLNYEPPELHWGQGLQSDRW